MGSVQSYILMTGWDQERRKVYKDGTDYIYVCDSEKGTALTEAKRKVKKIKLDGAWDLDEMRTNGWYIDPATSLAVVELLSFS